MKKYILFLALCSTSALFAQNGFGVKGGLNYADNGEITYSDVTGAGEDILKGGDSKMGYHFGAFYQASVLGFFLRPELLYTKTKSTYQFNQQEANYDVSKIDLPILVGTKFFGPVTVFAGPSLQYIIDNEFEGVEFEDVNEEVTIGAQLGAGIQLGRLGLDVRYERALKENERDILIRDRPDQNDSGLKRIDTRPSQIIFSISLSL